MSRLVHRATGVCMPQGPGGIGWGLPGRHAGEAGGMESQLHPSAEPQGMGWGVSGAGQEGMLLHSSGAKREGALADAGRQRGSS